MVDRRPFFKMTTTFPENPKIVAAGPNAAWLYLCGIAYCARNVTDGLIPKSKLSGLSNVFHYKAAASKLLELNLWHETGHKCPRCPAVPAGSFIVHDYLSHQSSASQVEVVRESRRVSGAKGGAAKARNREDAEKAASKTEPFATTVALPEVEVEEEVKPKVKTKTPTRKRSGATGPAGQGELVPLDAVKDPREEKAREIMKWWWDQLPQKPAGRSAWHSGVKVLTALLAAGHEPKTVAAAAREIGTPLTIPRMEIQLGKRNGSVNGYKPSTTDQRVGQALALLELYPEDDR